MSDQSGHGGNHLRLRRADEGGPRGRRGMHRQDKSLCGPPSRTCLSGASRGWLQGPYSCIRAPLGQSRANQSRQRKPQASRQDRNRYKRSEEHTSELQSLMRISYAVFCLKKKTIHLISASKTIKLRHINRSTYNTYKLIL